ncbi:MAG TPA: hypothetical protein VK766_03205 [Cytophagaceae bacterium]|jgi:hypothetical protein|nr:hypothetical protein [Cytophagaceae bacterium]
MENNKKYKVTDWKLSILALVLLLLVNVHLVSSQDNKKVEDLKKLGRKALIDRAVEIINDKDFHKENYDRTKVMVGQNKLYVIFDVSVRYIPVITSFYIPVYVDVLNNRMSVKEVSNSGFFSTNFYDTPSLYTKQVNFVINAINKSIESNMLPEGKVTEDITINIREVFAYYEVELISKTKNFYCRIDKVSGRLFEASSTDLPPQKESSLIELK